MPVWEKCIMSMRLLLNGKKANQESIRKAVMKLREEGHQLEVRATWEGGDFETFVLEAAQQNITRIIVGGGDGSINEVASALIKHNIQGISLAVLPLGTANDFATACTIPSNEPYDALLLAVTGKSYWVDAVQVNERYFINIATAGFGAQVTATTPVALKNFLGGGAYTLSGLIQAINFQPFQGSVTIDDQVKPSHIVVGAICNGRQAGGGQVLAEHAYIDDGLLDTISIQNFTINDAATVLEELQQDAFYDGRFVRRQQVKKMQWSSDIVMPINLDGEPIHAKRVIVEVLPQKVAFVLPVICPLLKHSNLAHI